MVINAVSRWSWLSGVITAASWWVAIFCQWLVLNWLAGWLSEWLTGWLLSEGLTEWAAGCCCWGWLPAGPVPSRPHHQPDGVRCLSASGRLHLCPLLYHSWLQHVSNPGRGVSTRWLLHCDRSCCTVCGADKYGQQQHHRNQLCSAKPKDSNSYYLKSKLLLPFGFTRQNCFTPAADVAPTGT